VSGVAVVIEDVRCRASMEIEGPLRSRTLEMWNMSLGLEVGSPKDTKAEESGRGSGNWEPLVPKASHSGR
jgi:hypothetical protein